MKLRLLVVALAAFSGVIAQADPVDRRVRSFRVSFPLSWKDDHGLPPEERRRLAAHALARTGTGRALLPLAGPGDRETRRIAIWALQFTTGFSYDNVLLEASADLRLRDEVLEAAVAAGPGSPAARRIWAEALAWGTVPRFASFPPNAVARMDPALKQSRDGLRKAVVTGDVVMRCAAFRAITEARVLDKEVLEAALAMARDESNSTRIWAAEYVATCGLDHPDAFEALLHAVAQGAGERAAWALLHFPERADEIELALLPVVSGVVKRLGFYDPEERVRLALVLHRLDRISEDVVYLLSLRRIDLPELRIDADKYGPHFAALLERGRNLAGVLDALPGEMLAREDVRALVRQHAASADSMIALRARAALWRGNVDREELVSWARTQGEDAREFLRRVDPVSRDERNELDRAIIGLSLALDPPLVDRLSRFRPFAAEIRDAVEPLLGDSHPRHERFRAARCLAELGFRSHAISAELKSWLLGPSPMYAEQAMEACTQVGIDLVDAYMEMLPDRRACLWLGLAGRTAATAAPKLAELVAREDCGLEALWALGEIGAPLDQASQERILAILRGAQPQ